MLIRNVTREQLEQGLKLVNKKYDNNIIWNNFKYEYNNTFRVTLKCKDSKKAGHRLGFKYGDMKQKRLISACWHVHGDFFDYLLSINPDVIIRVATHTIDKNGGNWEDRNIGSIMQPMYYSEACECE